MYKIFLTLLFSFIFISSSWAAFQISCPSKGITALNQTNQYITQAMVNGVMVNQITNYDVPYFNKLFNTTDCTISQVADPTPAQVAAATANMKVQMAKSIQIAQIETQKEANRKAYIDALMAGDTVTQQSVAASQASLNTQETAIK